MSARIARNLPALKAVKKMSVKNRKKYLKHAPNDFINAVSELCLNVLKQRVPLSACQLKSLKRHKRFIRQLASKRASIKNRRQVLIQRGGFLAGLLGPLIAAVVPLITSLFRRK